MYCVDEEIYSRSFLGCFRYETNVDVVMDSLDSETKCCCINNTIQIDRVHGHAALQFPWNNTQCNFPGLYIRDLTYGMTLRVDRERNRTSQIEFAPTVRCMLNVASVRVLTTHRIRHPLYVD